MKKNILATVLTLVMLLSLTACGGSAGSSSSSFAGGKAETQSSASGSFKPMVEEDAAEYEIYDTADKSTSAPSGSTVLTEQKMIYTAELQLETISFEETLTAISKLTEELGGYFENSSIGSRHAGYRYASYTVRVPKAQYNAFLNQVGDICHETWRNTSQENITEMYYDTAGRLETQKIKLERLQNLLAQAENMEDIITIESAISETEWQIENLSGTLRHYDARVDYATIYVNLNEVSKLSDEEVAPIGFGSRLGSAFTSGWNNFVNGLENLAVGLAYSWMQLLILVAMVVAVVKVLRRKGKFSKLRRKKAAVNNADPAQKPDDTKE